MRVLAIDPHMTKPYAVAIFEDGVFKSSGVATLEELHDKLNRSVDHVIIETQFVKNNVKVAMGLACSKGKVLGWCETHNISYTEVYPMSWKSFFRLTAAYNKDEDSIADKRNRITEEYGVKNKDQQDCIMMYKWWEKKCSESLLSPD